MLRHAFAAAGACAALCAFPAALADTGVRGAAVRPGSAFTGSAPARAHATGSGGMLYPEPSSGPPRQFPLSPSPTPTPHRTVRPPVTQRPSPAPASAVPRTPGRSPLVTVPKPSPKPSPARPRPTPAPRIAIPLTAYHPVPRKRLSTVLVLFVVAIVPLSLARVRRR